MADEAVLSMQVDTAPNVYSNLYYINPHSTYNHCLHPIYCNHTMG